MPIEQRRARALGIVPGNLPPGPLNAITDVAGVLVGHVTVVEGDGVRTGATTLRPHDGNLHSDRVPAGLAVGNGHGKLMGATQLLELGEIETPIVLTNTLAVPQAADAIIDWTLAQQGNEAVVSINPVVGECNDSRLNDIRRRVLTADLVRQAIETAGPGPVAEGSVGAGTGTVAFGWKGGVGTSSRRLPVEEGGFTVGVLVQTNFGGDLRILGRPVAPPPTRETFGWSANTGPQAPEVGRSPSTGGSIMIVVATDAPLSDRNLTRLAMRALAGLARTGAAMSNSSGDYALAFSTAESVRRTPQRRSGLAQLADWPNERMSPLFLAVIEATEEAIYNSLVAATSVRGFRGRLVPALRQDRLREHVGGSPGALEPAEGDSNVSDS